tara:strand:+ start:213989 stop:214207 length:219 start_codon:yes stop_codon:yes gene_type:complete
MDGAAEGGNNTCSIVKKNTEGGGCAIAQLKPVSNADILLARAVMYNEYDSSLQGALTQDVFWTPFYRRTQSK